MGRCSECCWLPGIFQKQDAAFIKGLQAAGFTNLSIDKLLEAKIHDVDGEFIKRAREKGFTYTQIDKYITLKIHGLADIGDE